MHAEFPLGASVGRLRRYIKDGALSARRRPVISSKFILTSPALGITVRQPSGLQFAVTGLMTLAFAIGVGRFAFTPIRPMMQKDAGLSLAAAVVLMLGAMMFNMAPTNEPETLTEMH